MKVFKLQIKSLNKKSFLSPPSDKNKKLNQSFLLVSRLTKSFNLLEDIDISRSLNLSHPSRLQKSQEKTCLTNIATFPHTHTCIPPTHTHGHTYTRILSQTLALITTFSPTNLVFVSPVYSPTPPISSLSNSNLSETFFKNTIRRKQINRFSIISDGKIGQLKNYSSL